MVLIVIIVIFLLIILIYLPKPGSNYRCVCDNVNTFWDSASSYCRTKQTYSESCSTYPCNSNYGLTCSSANACVCPTSMSGSYCDCPSTQYWNGGKCVNRATKDENCPTLQNYNCYTSKNLICSGGTCQCIDSNYYWDSSAQTCCNKFVFI